MSEIIPIATEIVLDAKVIALEVVLATAMTPARELATVVETAVATNLFRGRTILKFQWVLPFLYFYYNIKKNNDAR